MGLGLQAGESLHTRVGSYSGVHVHRRFAILAFLVSDAADEEKRSVRSWLSDEPLAEAAKQELMAAPFSRDAADTILYEKIPADLWANATDTLRGLWLWVNHSDCEGEHTPGEAAVVAGALKNLAIHARAARAEAEVADWLSRIGFFYAEAAETGEPVRFT